MAAFHGKSGTVTWDTTETQANVLSWTINATVDMAEITDMGDTVKTYVAGFKDWTATIEIETDSSGVLIGTSSILTDFGTAKALVLNDGNSTISGTGYLMGFSINTSLDGIVTHTLNIQGNGALS